MSLRRRVAAVAVVVAAAAAFVGPASAEGVLDVSVAGAGRVTGESGAVDCPGTCSLTRGITVTVSLHAIPAPGATFAGWTIEPALHSEPPNPFYVPIPDPVVEGCAGEPDCTLRVASSPDMMDPTCAPTPQWCGIIATYAYTRVTATFVAGTLDHGVFLCYSKWQVDPGVWPQSEARRLLDLGYWRPYAVSANASSTRPGSGDYALVCNLPLGMVVDADTAVDGGGNLRFKPPSAAPGYYPRALALSQ